MASPVVSNWDLMKSFSQYALFPDETQQDEHWYGVIDAIKWLSRDFIIHIVIHILFWNFMSNHQDPINITLNILVFSYHIIELIGDIALFRDYLTRDLRDYFCGYAPEHVFDQYQDLVNSLSQYRAYIRNERYGYEIQNDDEDICAICQEGYSSNNNNNQSLLWCGHKYHGDCLELYENSINPRQGIAKYYCPCCRDRYVPSTQG